MSKQVYAIEGLDRLGKSTLIQAIMNTLGFYQVIHFSKPQVLDTYYLNHFQPGSPGDLSTKTNALFSYQRHSFANSMMLAKSGARLIFDRWHLGECVYAPMYRRYCGEYVFDIERRHSMQDADNIRLILLTEDFPSSQHFVDDGLSLGSSSKVNREAEQNKFIEAFNRSIIPDKRIICVTDKSTGKFRNEDEILHEALS